MRTKILGAVFLAAAGCLVLAPEQKLLASDGAADDAFGYAVLVGSLGGIGGSAYVYRWNGTNWVEEQELLASNGGGLHQFGNVVAVSGDVALASERGTRWVYVFRFDGTSWVEEQRLVGSDAAPFDHHGEALAISGDVALVGASTGDGAVPRSGTAYIFRFDGTS